MAHILGRVGKVATSTDDATYNDINGLVDATLTINETAVDTSDHDGASFASFLRGRRSATLDLELRYDEEDTGQDALHDAIIDSSQALVYFRFRMEGDTSAKFEYKAQGFVTSFTQTMPNEDAAAMSVSVQLTGTITQANQS